MEYHDMLSRGFDYQADEILRVVSEAEVTIREKRCLFVYFFFHSFLDALLYSLTPNTNFSPREPQAPI